MIFKTKNKSFSENLFADMVILVGRYMEYKNMHSDMDKEKFILYYEEKNANVTARCIIQKKVVRQAKKCYSEKDESGYITYGKVKRIFRMNTRGPLRLKEEQYYLWEYVMDYIIEHKELLSIMIIELMKKGQLCSSDLNKENPFTNCLQHILGWYYVRIEMNNRIFFFHRDERRDKMISMFRGYELSSEFKEICRRYLCENKLET